MKAEVRLPRRSIRFYATCFVLHFFLLATVSCRETFWLLSRGPTILPQSVETYWRSGEALGATLLGQRLRYGNPVRQAASAYLHCAGIESGYGFFAPNVADSYKVVFELHYAGGQTEYALAGGDAAESDLRLASLMDRVGRIESDPARELMIKLLAHSVWQQHPQARMVRAILGSLTLPTAAEFLQGKSPSHEFLYAYDFTLSDSEAKPESE